jgi:hypothetical protein
MLATWNLTAAWRALGSLTPTAVNASYQAVGSQPGRCITSRNPLQGPFCPPRESTDVVTALAVALAVGGVVILVFAVIAYYCFGILQVRMLSSQCFGIRVQP